MRNTKVVDIISELVSYGADVDVHDPWVNADEAKNEYGLDLVSTPDKGEYDVVVLAVSHDEFRELGVHGIRDFGKTGSILYDVKYQFPKDLSDDRL